MIDIVDVFRQMNIPLSDGQVGQLNRYYEMLVEKNKVMNLTAITEYDDVVIKHFADSAALGAVYDLTEGKSLIDVGCGAGFPGLVLKIVYPGLSITLLDSLNKRVNFLNEVIEELGLTGISTVHGRAEDFGRNPDYREKYDLAVSRAVANLSSLSEYCLPFVKVNGKFISYKATDCNEEVTNAENAIRTLKGNISDILTYTIPGTDLERKFIVIHKKELLPKRFPRKAGMPTKEPLK